MWGFSNSVRQCNNRKDQTTCTNSTAMSRVTGSFPMTTGCTLADYTHVPTVDTRPFSLFFLGPRYQALLPLFPRPEIRGNSHSIFSSAESIIIA